MEGGGLRFAAFCNIEDGPFQVIERRGATVTPGVLRRGAFGTEFAVLARDPAEAPLVVMFVARSMGRIDRAGRERV
ncbi:hypothetical protein [Nannocystis pusilla]|uniref:hypothetical protein n=1 Tax=Nannocystis pusilla TaxID=889268 RepID=UPI003DA49CBD